MNTESKWQIKKRVYKRRFLSLFLHHLEPLPLEADIEPTTRCNMNCMMCQASSWKRRGKIMDKDLLLRILDQIPVLKRVKFQGMGEPFLHPQFFDLVKAMTEKGIEVTTFTNGLLLDSDCCQKIYNSGLKRIYISLDTLQPGVYHAIRGCDQLEKVLQNLERLAKKASPVEVCAITVIMKKNEDDLAEIAKGAIDRGVRRLAFQVRLSGWGKDEWMKKNDLQSAEKDKVEQAIKQINTICQTNHVELEWIRNCSLAPDQKCYWPFYRTMITCDGYVQPCCNITDPELFTFGNLRDTSFDNLWNGRSLRRFRSGFFTHSIAPFCRMCYGA